MLDFQATLVEAMQAKAPKMYRRLKRSGELDAYLEAQDKTHWDLLRELLKGEPRLPNGVVKNPVALSRAEETVLSQLLEFPEETQSDGRLEPPYDLHPYNMTMHAHSKDSPSIASPTPDFFSPRSWEGDIVRFANTPSGGLCLESWREGSWRKITWSPSPAEASKATPEELSRARVPRSDWGTIDG